MKKFATALIAAAIAAVSATSAVAAPICLNSYRIRSTHAPDAHHIVFSMVDGTKWTNTLKNACPGLLFNGFAYAPFAGHDVCENLQTIRVLEDHSVCMLGSFEKTFTPKHAA